MSSSTTAVIQHYHYYTGYFKLYPFVKSISTPSPFPPPMPSPEGGTVHIVVGDGGNYEGPALYEGHPPGWRQPQPLWSAFREASYGPGTGGGLQT